MSGIRFRSVPFLALLLVLLAGACGDAPEPTPVVPATGDPAASGDSDTVPPGGAARKRNVLLISLDTLRADHLGCYGYPRPVSPRIDRFAKDSVVFGHAYSHAPWTTPAHGALLTSLYPSILGLKRFPDPGRIADPVETLAEYFRDQGYRTHAVTEGGMVHADFGFDQGFEKYFQSAKHVDHGVGEALKWLRAHAKDRGDEPFFLFYHTYDIHRYAPPDEYRKLFVKPGTHRLDEDEELARHIQLLENEAFTASLTEEDLAHIKDLYDASIRWVDRYVGELLEHFERTGLLKNTVVVITSDHGEEFLERSRTGHGYSNFEEQIKVPLIIRAPGATAGSRATLFRHIDLAPTLAACLGLPIRDHWLGENLWPCVRDGDAAAPAGVRLSYCEGGHLAHRSLQTRQFKLVDDRRKKGNLALYDLTKDPGEKRDVLGEKEKMGRNLKKVMDGIVRANAALKARLAPGEGTGERTLPKELLDELRKLGYTK